MLSIENLGVEFHGTWLFRNASYQFLPGERIGLIGRNGAGKSTLLRIIHGDQLPSEGTINKSGSYRVAFFNQDLLSYESDRPIHAIAREAFAPLLDLKHEIEQLLQRMEQGKAQPEDLDRLTAMQAEFDTKGGNQIEAQVHSVLSGLGFTPEEQEQPYHTFSGGWRMRVLLAKMLLMQPNVLMLDEPTNHLDLPSIQWLEQYLKGFPGTCIVVSHDRFFIDRIADKILEISFKQLHEYAGNYSYYEKEKALRVEQQQKAYENQQKHIAEQEKFINRFRYKATKAKQVQSKIKLLEKLDRIEAPEADQARMRLQFEVRTRSGKEVLRLRNIHKAYDDKQILDGTEATVLRGDKIALIGANGTGKSTLLRIMVGTEPHEGTRETGHQVVDSFFAQHQLEALNLSNNILEEVMEVATDKTETEVRSILGCFMFSGEEVEKKIQVLSGGEKSRVALAKTLLSEANFLLLDEPTNHLDIESVQILTEALNAYEGTYVLVSHDRFFLENVANKIWYIEDHHIKTYPGTYPEFTAWQEKRAAQAEAESPPAPRHRPPESANESNGKSDYQEQKRIKNRIKKLERQQEQVEARITELEAEKEGITLRMAQPEVASDFDKLQEVQQELDALSQQLEEATEEWESVLLELEELHERVSQ